MTEEAIEASGQLPTEQPPEVEANAAAGENNNLSPDEEWQDLLQQPQQQEPTIPANIRLVTDESALSLSLNAIRLAVFCDSVTATVLDPNYAFMAYPKAHKDSFTSTEPFGFNGATYFLAMTALLGSAIGGTITGTVSDRIGRKPCILICLFVGAVGAIANYLARKSFWGFCVANFAQGLFSGSAAVAMAYVSDVKTTRKEKDEEIGIIVALAMLGTSGGGICAILMESQGLFTPLFVGAALNVVAGIFAVYCVIEPKKMLFVGSQTEQDDEDEEQNAPTEINKGLLTNIIAGALADNIGSAGLLPLAMSPLAFTKFYVVFLEQDLAPLMTQSAFKWISVMVALTVIPGAAFSQIVFDKIGAAGGCVAGNVITGIVTIICLFVAYIEPATKGTYAGFIIAFYVGFPFTVLSQLSTGPMLDTIAPVHRRGLIQGLNIAVMDFASAISPYILGEMADKVGIRETMWTCIGISFAAGLINLPLVFVKALKRAPPKPPKYLRALKGENADVVELAMKGEWVPAKELDEINDKRMKKGEPWLVIPYRPYEEDKHHLRVMRQQARGDFLYLRSDVLGYVNNPEFEEEEKREALAAQFRNSRAPPEQREEQARGLSKWFADYLVDSGYFVEDSPILYKQMIMAAFPPINKDEEITAENMEQVAVNYTRVLNKYLDDKDLTGARKAFAHKYVSVDC
ncbi:resistance protein [Seminavis robusta]|uniref:Resistance protein n=1 Tax=Seminavis robusta TaxID=568900 RepID=A0A9N8E332_9STRA|nr:resistance protein [Seminavis robusta]|eukprot:Sro567_g168010.1 resistance protein (688) ;mRNA; r:33699-35762